MRPSPRSVIAVSTGSECSAGSPGRCRRQERASSGRLAPHDAHEAHALPRSPTQVVGQAERAPALRHALDLALGRGLAAQLEPALEEHAETRRTDGMAEALESTVGVDRKLAVAV